MSEMTDDELELAVAFIQGTAVHNCLSGGYSYPSYLDWRLVGRLIVQYDMDFISPYRKNDETLYEVNMFIKGQSDTVQVYNACPLRAVLLCLVESRKEENR